MLLVCLLVLVSSHFQVEALKTVLLSAGTASGTWSGNCDDCTSSACYAPSANFNLVCTDPDVRVIYSGSLPLSLVADVGGSTDLNSFELQLDGSTLDVALAIRSTVFNITSKNPTVLATFKSVLVTLIKDYTDVYLTRIDSMSAASIATPRFTVLAQPAINPGNVYIVDTRISWATSTAPGVLLPLQHDKVEVSKTTQLTQSSLGGGVDSPATGVVLHPLTPLYLTGSTISSATKGPAIQAASLYLSEYASIKLTDMGSLANVNYVLNSTFNNIGISILSGAKITTELASGQPRVVQNGRLLLLPLSSADDSSSTPSSYSSSPIKVNLVLQGTSSSVLSSLRFIDYSATDYPSTTSPTPPASDLYSHISESYNFRYARVWNSTLSLRGSVQVLNDVQLLSTSLTLINATIPQITTTTSLSFDAQSSLTLGGTVSIADPFALVLPKLTLFPYAVASIPSLSMHGPAIVNPTITCQVNSNDVANSRPRIFGNNSWSLDNSHMDATTDDISNCLFDFTQVNVLRLLYNTNVTTSPAVPHFGCSLGSVPSRCIAGMPTNFLVEWLSSTKNPAKGVRYPLFSLTGPITSELKDKQLFNSLNPDVKVVSTITIQYTASDNVVSFLASVCADLPSEFICYPNGTIIAVGDVNTPNITLPPGSGTIIINGNLTTSTVIFQDSNTTLYITGCANISSITLELDFITSTGRRVLIKQSGTNCSSLDNIALTTTGGRSTCKKVTAKTESSDASTLSVFFQVNNSGCNTKWIILGAVLGGVVLLAVIALVLIFTLVPRARAWVRPYSKRKAPEANNIK